jgi:hypothetical protein
MAHLRIVLQPDEEENLRELQEFLKKELRLSSVSKNDVVCKLIRDAAKQQLNNQV